MENALQSQETVAFTQLNVFLPWAFDLVFALYVIVTVFLPNGTIYGINFKSPIYAALLPLAAFTLFRRQLASLGSLCATLAVHVILSVWLVVGVFYEFDLNESLSQYKGIWLTILLCWLAYIYCAGSVERRIRFLRIVLYSEIATCALKVGIIVYALIRGISVISMVVLLDQIFGVDLMTMDLGNLFGRIQFVSDSLIAVCVFIVLRHRDSLSIRPLQASLIMTLLVASVIFSFSRYFWIATAVALVLGLIFSKRDRFKLVLLGVLGTAIIASLPALVVLYQLRFSVEVAGSSDEARTEQIIALTTMFKEAPFLGKGLGSYSPASVRTLNENLNPSFGYEVQLLALSAQVGIVGMSLFGLLLAYYFSDIALNPNLRKSDRLSIFILLAVWISAGLTNPLLFLPIAGINFATLRALAGIPSRYEQAALE